MAQGLLISKKIDDYFEAKLSDLKPGRPIPFAIHLYFEKNDHVMVWCPSAETIAAAFLDKYSSRGVTRIWIHKKDFQAFQDYLNGQANVPVAAQAQEAEKKFAADTNEEPETQIGPDTPEAAAEHHVPGETAAPETPEGKQIAEALASPTLTPAQKENAVAKTAQKAIAEAAQAETTDEQLKANKHARQIVREVLENTLSQAESTASEIWRLSNVDPTFEHAVNVATYAVLFALAFGRIDVQLMADLALAGLLHDVGLSQIPSDIPSTPWKNMSSDQSVVYAGHVKAGLELLNDYAPDASQRVKTIITQHHEKFDGTGYPSRLQGFQVDDVAQLLCIADLMDSISSGQWDGEKRTLGDTLNTLERVEKQRTFPENFNPEVFAIVMKWTRNPDSAKSTEEAVAVVRRETQHVIGEKAEKAG